MTEEHAAATDDWAGERAARWVQARDGLERQLAPVADLLLGTARLRPGERVLDVGCGTGPTTHRAAVAVGPTGRVTGADIAGAMLDVARGVAPAPGAAPLDWVEADVATWAAAPGSFDVVLSRFGVMFFADPAAAFANLHRLTAPGGRLAVVTWAERARSPLFELPLAVVLGVCRSAGVEPDLPPAAAGPFSLPEAVAGPLLERAGWRDVAAEARPMRLALAGGVGPHEAAEVSMAFGPARFAAEALAGDDRRRAVEALAEAFRDHADGDGHVVLDATPVVVTARQG